MLKNGKLSPSVLISSNYKSMTKSEQKVADYINQHTDDILYSTVTDLSEKVRVGETTIIRFCRKLGYRGYQEFKLAIAQSLVNPADPMDGMVEEGDSLEAIGKKITQQNIKILNDSLELVDTKRIEKSISAVLAARSISFFGIGSSAFTAQDAEHRFMRMGFNVSHASDAHVMAMKAALVNEQDVVFGISTSGSTKDVVDAIRIARQNKAFIICLTNQGRSPITQYADVILLAASKESPFQGGAYSSKIAQLHILDILTKSIEIQQKDATFSSVKKTAEAVLDKMY
ncbi:MAG TPA: MurR/RpiR family transcriptional regulator [Bacillaceae bacterium]